MTPSSSPCAKTQTPVPGRVSAPARASKAAGAGPFGIDAAPAKVREPAGKG